MIVLKAINKALRVEATGGGVQQGALGSQQWSLVQLLKTPPRLTPKVTGPHHIPAMQGRAGRWTGSI